MSRLHLAAPLLALLLCTPALAQVHDAFGDLEAVIIPVADIAGNDGWMPLDEAMAKYGLDAVFERIVMEGGGEISCIGQTAAGRPSFRNRLVGWFLNGETDRLYTAGHFVYDKHEQLRPEMTGCHFALNAQVAEGNGYFRYPLPADLTSYRFGGTNPAGSNQAGDRAVVPLVDGAPHDSSGTRVARPVVARFDIVESLTSGDPVTLVSAARPFHNNLKGRLPPMAQRCQVLGVKAVATDQPRLIFTDCDSFKGVSGSLAFVADPVTGQMVAIGMQIRARETILADDPDRKAIDGLLPSMDVNSSLLLALDQNYFSHPYSGNDLALEVDGNTFASDPGR